MYYIEEEKDELVKYEVELNIEELERLENEIINNCCEITHYDYKSETNPLFTEDVLVLNYKSTYLGVREYNDFLAPYADVYRYEYDEYKIPDLAKIVKKLLSGDVDSILELENTPKNSNIIKTIDLQIEEKINLISSMISKKDEIDFYRLEEENVLLKQLYEYKKLNQDRKSEVEYYEQVKSCIKFKEVSRLKKEILEEIKTFFENTTQHSINDNKVLRK